MIKIPGSVLQVLERRGVYLVVRIMASGQTAELLFFHGTAHGNAESLPLELASGKVAVAGEVIEDQIPVPFPHAGTVEIHLGGAGGENLIIVGQSLTARFAGPGPLVSLGGLRK